jgi:hypothetical protein
MTETDYDYLDAILSTRRTDSAPTTTMDLPTSKLPFDYFPETPSALTGDLFSPSTIKRLAVLAGGITTVIRDKARQVLPQADIPSLLRDLRYTLIEHQYQTWIERNVVQPRGSHKPSYVKPKGPTKDPSPPSSPHTPPTQAPKKRKRRNRKDTWSRQRQAWKRQRSFWTTITDRHRSSRQPDPLQRKRPRLFTPDEKIDTEQAPTPRAGDGEG